MGIHGRTFGDGIHPTYSEKAQNTVKNGIISPATKVVYHLVGGLGDFLFFHILGIILPTPK
jgi:hypothetical protein